MSSEGRTVMLQLIEAAERIRAVAQSTDLPMSAMLDDVAKLLDQVDDSGNYCAARIAELEADRDRLAAIVERARNGDRAGGSATIWSLREQRDNCLVRIAELEAIAAAYDAEAAAAKDTNE